MQLSLEEFKKNFPTENIEIVSYKKRYFKKYLLIKVEFDSLPGSFTVQKSSDQLKKLYKTVLNFFPNFPLFKKKHDKNFKSILEQTKEEMKKNKDHFLLSAIYGFLYKSKEYNYFNENDKEILRK